MRTRVGSPGGMSFEDYRARARGQEETSGLRIGYPGGVSIEDSRGRYTGSVSFEDFKQGQGPMNNRRRGVTESPYN